LLKQCLLKVKNFILFGANECESINVCPNTYTEICSGAPLRLRYVAKQDWFKAASYNRYNKSNISWVECAHVTPLNNVCQKITFCSGNLHSRLAEIWGSLRNTNDLRVGPTYAQWVNECSVKSCPAGKCTCNNFIINFSTIKLLAKQ